MLWRRVSSRPLRPLRSLPLSKAPENLAPPRFTGVHAIKDVHPTFSELPRASFFPPKRQRPSRGRPSLVIAAFDSAFCSTLKPGDQHFGPPGLARSAAQKCNLGRATHGERTKFGQRIFPFLSVLPRPLCNHQSLMHGGRSGGS